MTPSESIYLIHKAIDRGITFMDTSRAIPLEESNVGPQPWRRSINRSMSNSRVS